MEVTNHTKRVGDGESRIRSDREIRGEALTPRLVQGLPLGSSSLVLHSLNSIPAVNAATACVINEVRALKVKAVDAKREVTAGLKAAKDRGRRHGRPPQRGTDCDTVESVTPVPLAMATLRITHMSTKVKKFRQDNFRAVNF